MDLSELLPSFSGLPVLPHVRDLGISYALAAPIGWNRERQDRSAGLRTFPLVAIAACGFVQASEVVLAGSPEGIGAALQGIITGIGFIGGGAILKGEGHVHGTATAAGLWATGAVGVAIGLGRYDVGAIIALFTAATLFLVTPLKSRE